MGCILLHLSGVQANPDPVDRSHLQLDPFLFGLLAAVRGGGGGDEHWEVPCLRLF